jgi:DhnA family fructose-bisphosphate aldolase class Ia
MYRHIERWKENRAMDGLGRRTARISAADGKTVVLAFDHGTGGARHAGMRYPGETLKECIAAGADSVLITPGLARQYGDLLTGVGVVLNLDLASDHDAEAVREAILLGAEMGKFIFLPGSPTVPDSLQRTRHLIAVAHDAGLPMMIEPIPVSFEEKSAHTPQNIGQGAKIACEIGADIVKMQYSGDPDSFQEIMDTVYRPVVILGGPGRGNVRAVLEDIRHAMDAGAIGTTIGRNIWEHESPARVVAALAAIVHEDASVDVAMRQLEPSFAVA